MKNCKIGMMAFVLCIFLMGCTTQSEIKPVVTSTPVVITHKTMNIYTINSEDMIVAPLTVQIEKSQLTVAEVAKLVADNLDEKVVLYKIEQKKDTVIVSFADIGAPTKGCSADVESMILQCFANSILDNVKDCKKIIFRSQDEAYEGGHLSYDKNEVYASN